MSRNVAKAAQIVLGLLEDFRAGASAFGHGPLTQDDMRALASAYATATPPKPLADALEIKYAIGGDPMPMLSQYMEVVFAAGFSAGSRWATTNSEEH